MNPPRTTSGLETTEGAAAAPAGRRPHGSILAIGREWCDAIVITIVLAMFIRLFLVELYKIPSGSMSPTLIGGQVVETDYNNDGLADLLVLGNPSALLFLNDGQRLVARGPVVLGAEERDRYEREGAVAERDDRILVNKFAYWWSPPRRGDIVVFKVPERIWAADKAIYIKRCVGEPGDHLEIDPAGRLEANGDPVDTPPFFRTQRYVPVLPEPGQAVDSSDSGRSLHVSFEEIFVFGDNTLNSRDSRYWGGVPLDHLRGRPFFRYFPLGKMKFLNSD
ncbi:MAG: signal peptidase I [Candidatus Sumerlaeia bacterium]